MSTDLVVTPSHGPAAGEPLTIDFRALAEQSSVGLWVIDPEGYTLYANGKTGELLDTTPAAMLGHHFTDYVNPDDLPLAAYYFDRRQRGIFETHEFKFRRADGRAIWSLVQTSPLKDGDVIRAWVARLMDISDAVMDRQHARLISETLRRFVVYSRLPIAHISNEGTIQSVNRAFEELVGQDGPDLLGTTAQALFHIPDPIDWRARAAATSPASLLLTIGDRTAEAVALPTFNPVNEDGILLLLHDVTEREATLSQEQNARSELEERVRAQTAEVALRATAMEATLEGMAIIEGPDFRWVNRAHAEIFGWSVDELTGQNWRVLHDEASLRYMETVPAAALRESGHWRGEVTCRGRDGRTVLVELSITMVVNGPVPVFVAGCRDITQRHQHQARLLETLRSLDSANERLREAGRLKDLFLACMSHELRTPLHSILGTTEVALDGYAGNIPAQLRGYLDQIQTSGEHLLALINDVLDVSKIGAGQLMLDLTEASAQYLLGTALDMIVRRAQAKSLRIVRDIPDAPIRVRADEVRVVQILANLLSNAVKFTGEGGEVRVTLRSIGDVVEFVVADTGSGFAPEAAQLLFQPFRQLDGSLTRRHGGTGLGLYLARQLAELHGGAVTALGHPGKGAEFTLVLPRTGPAPDAGKGRPS